MAVSSTPRITIDLEPSLSKKQLETLLASDTRLKERKISFDIKGLDPLAPDKLKASLSAAITSDDKIKCSFKILQEEIKLADPFFEATFYKGRPLRITTLVLQNCEAPEVITALLGQAILLSRAAFVIFQEKDGLEMDTGLKQVAFFKRLNFLPPSEEEIPATEQSQTTLTMTLSEQGKIEIMKSVKEELKDFPNNYHQEKKPVKAKETIKESPAPASPIKTPAQFSTVETPKKTEIKKEPKTPPLFHKTSSSKKQGLMQKTASFLKNIWLSAIRFLESFWKFITWPLN